MKQALLGMCDGQDDGRKSSKLGGTGTESGGTAAFTILGAARRNSFSADNKDETHEEAAK